MLGESEASTDAMRQMLEGSKNSIGTMLLNRKTLERLTAITKGEATEPAPASDSAPATEPEPAAENATDEPTEEENSEAKEGA